MLHNFLEFRLLVQIQPRIRINLIDFQKGGFAFVKYGFKLKKYFRVHLTLDFYALLMSQRDTVSVE